MVSLIHYKSNVFSYGAKLTYDETIPNKIEMIKDIFQNVQAHQGRRNRCNHPLLY